MSDSQDNPPPLDLSNLRLMPNWVADFGTSKSTSGADFPEEDTRGRRDFKDRGPGRGGFGDRRSGPGGGGGGAGGGDRRTFDRSRSGPGAGPSGDRRGPGGGGYRGDRDRGPRQYGQGQGQGYGRDERDNRGNFDQAPRPVPGISVSVEPESRAMEAMAGMIRTAGKAYSVFDAARLVLANGDRFHVKFSLAADAPGKLYTVPVDGSLWLSREDALANFLQGDALKEYYVAEQIELEEPKGNFASIAVCGMTGELLGPPSHHSYQTNLHRLHRDRFSNLPFEEYKRRVRTDNSPEAVAKWKESQKHGTEWVYQKGEVTEGAEPLRLKSRVDMENHFRKVHADTLVGEVSEATVAGSIPKKLLAPSLYIHLRRAVDEARKHLLATAQQLCSGFEHHGLKLFKRRGGKLWVSRVRPRALDASVVLSDRIAKLVELIKTKPGISTKELLDLMVPPAAPAQAKAAPAPAEEAVAEAPVAEVQAPETAAGEVVESTESSAPEAAATEDSAPAEAVVEAPVQAANVAAEAPEAVAVTAEVSPEQVQALKDLHWLNSEGYVIEYADGVVFPGVTEPPPAKPKPVKAAPVAAAAVAGEAVADAAAVVDGEAVEGATETEAAPAAEVAADEAGESAAPEAEAATAPEEAAEAPPEQAPVEAEVAASEAEVEVEAELETAVEAATETETASEEITEPDVTGGSTDPVVQAIADADVSAPAPAEAEVEAETEAQVAEEVAK